MKSNYNQLGQYIEMVSRTNSDLKYGIEDVRGCSNTKQMMQTRANLIGRTYEKFIVLRPQEFVFNRRTTRNGEKIGMAYNNTDREYIFTNDYVAFRVKQEYLDKLLPDYLYLFFCRDEFDRYARYKSTGSATEFFNWEDMCAVPFEIPPMDFQQLVVNAYKVLNKRIETKQKINDNLEATLSALYKEFFTITSSDELPFGWRVAPFSDIAAITMGQSPQGDDCNNDGVGEPLLNGPTEFGFYSPSPVQWTTNGKKHCVEGDLLFCVRGSTTGRMNWANQSYAIGRGLAAIHHKSDCTLNWFVKAMIDNSLQEILSAATGSTFPNVGKDLLNGFQVIIPDDNSLREFGVKGHSIFSMISNNAKEIDALVGLQRTLLSKLTI